MRQREKANLPGPPAKGDRRAEDDHHDVATADPAISPATARPFAMVAYVDGKSCYLKSRLVSVRVKRKSSDSVVRSTASSPSVEGAL